MQVQFLQPAQYELDQAIDYYNAQAPNLGQAFLLEILASLDRICLWPDAWHLVSKNTRRCQLKRFPYGIIYSKIDNVILVIAIGHLHRSPEYWRDIKSR
jgi:ParE toxin of type II toxin-antitoxin system, parDE